MLFDIENTQPRVDLEEPCVCGCSPLKLFDIENTQPVVDCPEVSEHFIADCGVSEHFIEDCLKVSEHFIADCLNMPDELFECSQIY